MNAQTEVLREKLYKMHHNTRLSPEPCHRCYVKVDKLLKSCKDEGLAFVEVMPFGHPQGEFKIILIDYEEAQK